MAARPDVRQISVAERPPIYAHPDRALARLAARQHGVVARRQLPAAGLTPSVIKSRIACGRLIRLHHGVYAVGHASLTDHGRWMAAVLAAGLGALLSHSDAAALHRLRPPGDHVLTDVTTTARVQSTLALRVHHTRNLDPRDRAVVAAIPTTSVARTLVDLAAILQPRPLMKVLDEAERRRLLDPAALRDALDRVRTRRGPGHARLSAALDRLATIGAQPTESELEDAFLAIVDGHDLPQPRTGHHLRGFRVDACWPEHGLVVELDGWAFHNTRRSLEDDRTRANVLQAHGWRVLRFTYRQLTQEPRAVADLVAAALAR